MSYPMSKKNNKITILHEDDHLVVLNKPAHVLSIPDRYIAERLNLVDFLKERYEDIFVVHRLDKETSGVICYAKTAEAHRHLNKQFEARTTQKIYQVIVEGHPVEASGIIDKPISRHLSIAGKMRIHKSGKPSITHYEVKEAIGAYSLLHADIKTGRTHQIRIHFASIGHPLLVDKMYGRQEAFFLSSLKQKKYNLGKDQEERPLMSRTSLHSWQLRLDHPDSGERMEFTAPLPKDFSAVVKQLRKWA